jgi:hypothetical protein
MIENQVETTASKLVQSFVQERLALPSRQHQVLLHTAEHKQLLPSTQAGRDCCCYV